MREHSRYAVLIGGLVGSRSIRARDSFQSRLVSLFTELSASESICSPLTLTLGDEFQAVFSTGKDLFKTVMAIRAAIHPVPCRFAISIGTLTTTLNPHQAIGMDGPAFYKARDALEELKLRKQHLALCGYSSQLQALLGPTIDLLWASTRTWKTNRLEILSGLLDGQTEQNLANRLAVSERAIYKNIHDAQLHRWVELIQEVEMRITHMIRL